MINIRTEKEIEKLRASGGILSDIFCEIEHSVKSGISTMDIEIIIRKLLKKNNVKSPFLGYRGYPAASCISVNEELVHGIPSIKKIIKNGDIVSIDLGVVYKGYITDAARTFIVGDVDLKTKELVFTTKQAFYNGACKAVDGNHLYDISFEIMKTVENKGFSVVRDFVSHGVGVNLHEEPSFCNYGRPKTGPILKYGMILAIEPMVNMGSYEIEILDDGWTAVTKDGKFSAHYENTVLVGKEKVEILTQKEIK